VADGRPAGLAADSRGPGRLAVHAFCGTHPEARPRPDCAFCGDRAAYRRYLAAGGRDFTMLAPPCPAVPLGELPPSDRFTWEAGLALGEREIAALAAIVGRDTAVTGHVLAGRMREAGRATTTAAAHQAGAALARKGLAIKGQPGDDLHEYVRYEITNQGREWLASYQGARPARPPGTQRQDAP
jgi:hypothetical protein